MTVCRMWRAFGLEPDRIKTLKLSPDPWLGVVVGKVRDIVGLYVDPFGARRRAVCRREAADSGGRPDGAAVADAAGSCRAERSGAPVSHISSDMRRSGPGTGMATVRDRTAMRTLRGILATNTAWRGHASRF